MPQQQTALQDADISEVLRSLLKSQYHAVLAMLREAIARCPDDLWSSAGYTNPFWRIAYHALYYTHLYIQPTMYSFRAWEHHQTGLQYMDDIPGPPEIDDIVELPHKPPQTGKPYTKEEVLVYWSVCDGLIDDAIDAIDPLDPESGFSWYSISKLEHQLVSLRHTQHHTAQLVDRLRSVADIGVEWVGARRPNEAQP